MREHPLRLAALTTMMFLLLGGCDGGKPAWDQPSQQRERKIAVETYPQPVDPATVERCATQTLPPPKILEGPLKSTLIYTCRYTRCEVLKEAIEGFISPEGTIEASTPLNVLLLSDAKELVPGLLKLIQDLDHPVPQILVEARVVEVTVDSDFEYELAHTFTTISGNDFLQKSDLTLTTPGSDPNPTLGARINIRPLVADGRRLDDFLRLLLTRGKAKILSSPNLIVGAGSEASIITGEEVPIQSATVVSGSVSTTTLFKRVGIKLRVTPLQIAGDTAKVEINPEVSSVTRYTAAGATGVSNPIVAIRNVRSTLAVKDGEIVTIGGLLSSVDRETIEKVPGLGDIPLLGLLFQSKRVQSVQTQLIFFLRINILQETKPGTIRIHRPGAGLEGLDRIVENLVPGFLKRPSTQPAFDDKAAADDDEGQYVEPVIIHVQGPAAPAATSEPALPMPTTLPTRLVPSKSGEYGDDDDRDPHILDEPLMH